MDITKSKRWRYKENVRLYIRLSEKCLPFANVFFTTVQLRTNVKPSLWNVTVFISTEQNGSYVIRRNNIKRKTLCVYFLLKRKILFGQPNTFRFALRSDIHLANYTGAIFFHKLPQSFTRLEYSILLETRVFRRETFPYDFSRRPSFLKDRNELSERPNILWFLYTATRKTICTLHLLQYSYAACLGPSALNFTSFSGILIRSQKFDIARTKRKTWQEEVYNI